MPTLQPGTFPAYYSNYFKFIEADTIDDAIAKWSDSIIQFFSGITEEKSTFRYAEGKWSLKEMLQHIIDTERIFAYRALCFARGEQVPLPGFDENTYAAISKADDRTWESLVQELKAVRLSTDLLLISFSPDLLQNKGITNEQPNTLEAICFVIYGHILHHINVAKERYLSV